MSSADRRERERAETREMILQAALRLFLEASFEATTMRRIADAVEYSPGALYSYFKDKDEIFYALHQRGFEKLIAMQRAELIDVHEPLERLNRIGRTYLRFGLENPAYYHLMFIAKSTSRTIVETACWDPGLNAYGMLRQTVEAVIAAHDLDVDVDIVAFTAWSAVHGMVSLVVCDRCVVMQHLDLNRCVEQAFAFFMQLIQAAPRKAPGVTAPPPAPARRI